MIRRTVVKYAACVWTAARLACRERGELYGRMAFFAVILGVFSTLWRALHEASLPVAADPKRLVWYLAATEWILLSAPTVHLEIEEAIRRGDVIYELGRPVSYVGRSFAEGLGLLAVRAPVLGVTAFVCAFAFTGWTPPAGALVWVAPFGLAASALLTALYLAIGLLAFWLHDVSPVYWVWQKLLFVLGGLMMPLELYPEFVRRVATLTPFPALLGGPASFVLRGGRVGPMVLAWHLAIWSGTTAVTLRLIVRRATSTLTVNGG